MTDRYTEIHPELAKIARRFPKFTISRRNLWLLHLMMPLAPRPRAPHEVRVGNIDVPRADRATSIRVRVYRPREASGPVPALLWLHGGGYVMGRPEQDDGHCFEFVRELGITVVSVSYRCAPKHPFPAALDDSYAILRWMVSHAGELGVDVARVAVGGASAGGGLAAALVQRAHDGREIEPVFQLLVYPMLDDRSAAAVPADDREYVAWNRASNRFGWESYLGKHWGAPDVPDYAVPARRRDLAGLPPAWIGVGTIDLFYEEDLEYARRLESDGVPCETVTVPGAFHGFDTFESSVSVVRGFRAAQISALRQHLLP